MHCQSEFYYIVKPNDTLYKISHDFQVSIDDILMANQNQDLSILSIGQVLRICYRMNLGENALNVINTIRMLWEQHGAWTRMVISSIIFDAPDKDFEVSRLLRNPKDFANVLNQFYGLDIANKFEKLLTDHLVLAADLVKAAKEGNTKLASETEAKWYQNATDIAIFLSRSNPYFILEEWQEMMFEHLGFVKMEAVDILNKEYQKSIDTYDKMEIQILEMADMMANGIISQFQIR